MNERIKQLAYEAGLYFYPRGTCCMDEMFPRHFNVAEADEAYTKFAELIVRECAEFIKEWERYQVDMANQCNGNFPTGGDSELKEHFGVE